MRLIDTIVIHCSATAPDVYVDAAVIERGHRRTGKLRIGYHYVIKRDGEIEVGRPVSMVGAHAAGNDASSIGICMVGGVDKRNRPENNFTPDQFGRLRSTLFMLRRHLVPSSGMQQILGHRDLPPAFDGDGALISSDHFYACPSFDVRAWVRENL